MSDFVTLTIDGHETSVPKGTLVVDAAKRNDIDIPVFCYHPKMKPVGMCRMCLVEIGMPVRDRETGELILGKDGNPKINFGQVLQTGCTVTVAEGMVVRTTTESVKSARDDTIEFLLTSHPLDCPICDKGGECPLQNLAVRYGPGSSRFYFDDKMKLAKHVPLGELIYLDRERCIQCARCVRFQDEIVDDPVIAFHNRGRKLEIVTMSEPGFNSYWSGNTTDICPVGALTSSDFRFGARPWEMTPVASICPHCPVGCNTTMSTRREAKSGGQAVIKRIMPRQNEGVNEIWICDKGRFVHHFSQSPERLTKPLIREGDRLVEASWEEALDLVAGRLQMAKTAAAGLANDRLSNEDLFLFQKLFRKGLESPNVDLVHNHIAGGDVIANVGLTSSSNLGELGAGDAILVVASDLHEEAPVWWLRVKQAVERGALLVTLNLRPTRLDKYSKFAIHYKPNQALSTVHQLLNAAKIETDLPVEDPLELAADQLIQAQNLVIFYGGEGLNYRETDGLARMLGNLLLVKKMNGGEGQYHAGRVNNGLVAVWPHGNTQGAWDMGVHPALGPGYSQPSEPGMGSEGIVNGVANGEIKALYLMGADPVGDGILTDRDQLDFLVVQELFLTETAKLADVVLPAQSWAEREGTFTSGERRVQRFYPAIPVIGDSRADWQILAQVGERLGLNKPPLAASLVFREIAEDIPLYSDFDYRSLARTEEQWPKVGDEDLYYGGTVYNNQSGLGLQWAAAAESGSVESFEVPESSQQPPDGLPFIHIASLYERGTLIGHTELLSRRIPEPIVYLHPDDVKEFGIGDGDRISIRINGRALPAQTSIEADNPESTVLIRGIGNNADLMEAEITKEEQG